MKVNPTNDKAQSRSIGEVKAHFAECIRAAEAGLTTVLTRHGRPVARIEPYRDASLVHSEIRELSADYGAHFEDEFRSPEARRATLRRLLEEEIWPRVPEEVRGKAPTKKETEDILGYGENGV